MLRARDAVASNYPQKSIKGWNIDVACVHSVISHGNPACQFDKFAEVGVSCVTCLGPRPWSPDILSFNPFQDQYVKPLIRCWLCEWKLTWALCWGMSFKIDILRVGCKMHSGVGKCKKEIYSQFPLASVDTETSYHALSSTPRHIEGVTCFNFHMVPTWYMKISRFTPNSLEI